MIRAEVDYYSVLGVDKNADKKAIKQAYRCPSASRSLKFTTRIPAPDAMPRPSSSGNIVSS